MKALRAMSATLFLSTFLMQSILLASHYNTLDEIAKHASIDDCWILIQSKVYDITSYIPKHPAPKAILLKYCGKEADQGWQTKENGRNHSSMALKILNKFEKGMLKVD